MQYTRISEIPRDFCYTLTVSPKLAQSILTEGRLQEAHRRPIRQDTIAYLRKQIRNNKFEDGTALIFVVLNNRTYLANGRHRVTAILQCNYTADFNAVVIPIQDRKRIPQVLCNSDFSMPDLSALRDLPGMSAITAGL